MASFASPWGIIYLSAAALVWRNPDYAVTDSRIVTLVLLFTAISLWRAFYRLTLYPAIFTPLKNIPSPKERSWLRGNSRSLFLETPFELMAEWIKTVPNDGLIRYYIVGNLERVMLTSPKALAEVLVHKVYQFPKPEFVRLNLGQVTGHGVLLAEGEEHKIQRKNLMPAFGYRHIKDLYPTFWAKSVEMVHLMEDALAAQQKSTGSNVLQISNWSGRATLDIIGVAGMDQDFGSLRDPINELSQQYHKLLQEPGVLMKIMILLGLFLVDMRLIFRLPLRRNKEVQASAGVIRSVARQVIRKKKEKMERQDSEEGTKDVDIISVALQSGTFSEENLVDQMMTFLGAGHETTSTALQWAVYALSKHQDVQTRLREEIRAHLPSISVPANSERQPITAAMIDSLPYLNAVCNEVLRFHPSVPATVRIATQDTTLVGQRIPKNTLIMLAPQIINRSKELWGDDADIFNPERWMGPGRANTGGAESNYAYLTFLHGPRSCIGQSFAKAELACLVAAVVGRFQMELQDPDKKLELRAGPTVSPKDGVLAKMMVIEGW